MGHGARRENVGVADGEENQETGEQVRICTLLLFEIWTIDLSHCAQANNVETDGWMDYHFSWHGKLAREAREFWWGGIASWGG